MSRTTPSEDRVNYDWPVDRRFFGGTLALREIAVANRVITLYELTTRQREEIANLLGKEAQHARFRAEPAAHRLCAERAGVPAWTERADHHERQVRGSRSIVAVQYGPGSRGR